MPHTHESPWLVYILECADGTLYCGVTTDLDRRIAEHNGARPGGARYTRSRRPVRVAASAACTDRSSACSLEARIKRLPRAEKIAFLRELSHAVSDDSDCDATESVHL